MFLPGLFLPSTNLTRTIKGTPLTPWVLPSVSGSPPFLATPCSVCTGLGGEGGNDVQEAKKETKGKKGKVGKRGKGKAGKARCPRRPSLTREDCAQIYYRVPDRRIDYGLRPAYYRALSSGSGERGADLSQSYYRTW